MRFVGGDVFGRVCLLSSDILSLLRLVYNRVLRLSRLAGNRILSLVRLVLDSLRRCVGLVSNRSGGTLRLVLKILECGLSVDFSLFASCLRLFLQLSEPLRGGFLGRTRLLVVVGSLLERLSSLSAYRSNPERLPVVVVGVFGNEFSAGNSDEKVSVAFVLRRQPS